MGRNVTQVQISVECRSDNIIDLPDLISARVGC